MAVSRQVPNSSRARQKIVHGKPNYAYGNGQAPEGEVNANYENYVTSRGHEIIFLPMPPMLKEKIEAGLNSEWPMPQPTTYQVKTVTGDTETHTHTAKTAKDADEQAAWDAYVDELQRWTAENWSRFLRALQIECIRFEEKEGWEERQEFLKILPKFDNKFHRALHYIQTEIVGDPEDIVACFTIPLRLAGAPDEQLETVENSFRASIRQKETRQTPQRAARK